MSLEYQCQQIKQHFDMTQADPEGHSIGYSNQSTPIEVWGNLTIYNDTSVYNFTGGNRTDLEGNPVLECLKYYLLGVVQPCLCCFGILGNLLNIVVLSRKKFKTSLDCSMEIAAMCGLIALALSDILYCVSVLPKAFLKQSVVIFNSMNFYMVYQMYSTAIQNIFTYISTWLTVLMATTRYIAICRPLHARYLVETRATILTIISIVVFCFLLGLPAFWKFSYILCSKEGFYVIDQGFFVTQKSFRKAFTYVWCIIGFFIPMAILVYCNIHLIGALRESMRMRKHYTTSNKTVSPGSHITPTLVAVICQFLLLMTPSEVINFYYFAVGQDVAEAFTFAIVVTNILQTLNFSLNFILYCIVNSRFRSTLLQLITCRSPMRDSKYHMRMSASYRSSAVSHTRHSLLTTTNKDSAV